jgi:DNA-binding CsgD family transcriptional regulator
MPWQRKIDYQEAEMLLRDGLALQAIADRLKVSTSAIRNISKLLGIFSPPGRRRKADYDLVLLLGAEGLTQLEIGRRVGLSQSRVCYILQQSGQTGRLGRAKGADL